MIVDQLIQPVHAFSNQVMQMSNLSKFKVAIIQKFDAKLKLEFCQTHPIPPVLKFNHLIQYQQKIIMMTELPMELLHCFQIIRKIVKKYKMK